MDRIPLPAEVIARQQKITVAPNGEITRDRMVLVHQKEIVPMYDPVVREWASSQLAQQRIDEATTKGAVQAMVVAVFLVFFGIPFGIFMSLVYF
jgi:hypothetical protein